MGFTDFLIFLSVGGVGNSGALLCAVLFIADLGRG